MLANFLGVLPIPTPPLCALAFIMCSKSNPVVVFALDLMSTYEGEHTIFGLLGQAKAFISTCCYGNILLLVSIPMLVRKTTLMTKYLISIVNVYYLFIQCPKRS
jgi:hypothetical protein